MAWWYNLSDKIRFILVGGLNFCISYIIYVVFCKFLGSDNYQISLALSWILSSFISFTTQKILVFQSGGAPLKEYLKCCTTWFVSYIINAILLEITVKYLNLNIYAGQIIAVTAASICTYIMFKHFAFRKNC